MWIALALVGAAWSQEQQLEVEPEAPVPVEVAAPDARIALTNLQVWDAVDGLRSVESVVLDGDRVVHVGPLPSDLGADQIRDLGGATVIPGLMDLHVHLALSPGAHFRPDEDPDAAMRHHLAAYVACGVTTVLDTGSPLEGAQRIRRLSAQGPSPDVHLLGPLVSPEGGYVSVVLPELFEPARTPEEVAEQVAAFDVVEPFGIKATLEEGMFLKVWPVYPDAVAQAVMAEAAARDEGVYAHAMSAAEYRMGLDLGVSGFVHPTQSPKGWLVRELAERELPVISTLSVFDHMLIEFEPDRLGAATFQRVVPPIELEMAVDAEIQAQAKDLMVAGVLPDRHGLIAHMARKLMDKPGLVRARTKRMQRSIAKQHAAGVPIVMGSDSGNWPIFLTEFHGPTSVREVELLAEAGLGAEQALVASTWNPAKLLGIEEEVGRIAPGLRADLVVLPRNPLDDLSAIWEPVQVVRAGVIDTPDGWMARLSAPPAEALPEAAPEEAPPAEALPAEADPGEGG